MSFTDPKAKGSIEVGRGNGFTAVPVGPDGNVLTVDGSQTAGIKWDAPPGAGAQFPLWMFGDGSDGNVTLVADTVLATYTPMMRYDNLDLGGFILECDPTAVILIVYVKDTLTLGGGTIRGCFREPVINAGGAGGGATGGAGGDAGRGRSGVWVFAKTITGTGSIHSDGESGADGADGAVNSAVAARADGAYGDATFTYGYYLQGNLLLGASGGGVGAFGGPGGAGGAAGSFAYGFSFSNVQVQWRDLQAIIFNSYPVQISFLAAPVIDPGNWGRGAGCGSSGVGGTGGNQAEGNTGAGGTGEGGSGGPGGSQAFGTSGSGGAGGDGNGDDAAATSGASAGGSGASGAGGGFVCVLSNSAPATLTVSADAGNGGKGGNGVAAPSGRESGGSGGGGGGGGGVAILVAQSGNGATVTADGGVGGAGGTAGGGASTDGGAGVDGDPGLVFNMTYN